MYPIYIELADHKGLLELVIDRHSVINIPAKIRIRSKHKEQDYRTWLEAELSYDSSNVFCYLGEIHRKATKYNGLVLISDKGNVYKYFQLKVIKSVLEENAKLLSDVYL